MALNLNTNYAVIKIGDKSIVAKVVEYSDKGLIIDYPLYSTIVVSNGKTSFGFSAFNPYTEDTRFSINPLIVESIAKISPHTKNGASFIEYYEGNTHELYERVKIALN